MASRYARRGSGCPLGKISSWKGLLSIETDCPWNGGAMVKPPSVEVYKKHEDMTLEDMV